MTNYINTYVPPFLPLTGITPFTYRDGATYLEVLEGLRAYVNDTLVDFVNTKYAELGLAFETQVNILITDIEAALTLQQDNVNLQLEAQNTSVTAQLAAQNTAIIAIVNDMLADWVTDTLTPALASKADLVAGKVPDSELPAYLKTVVEGSNVTIDVTDPYNPVISSGSEAVNVKGNWIQTANYAAGDVVYADNASWIATETVTGVAAPIITVRGSIPFREEFGSHAFSVQPGTIVGDLNIVAFVNNPGQVPDPTPGWDSRISVTNPGGPVVTILSQPVTDLLDPVVDLGPGNTTGVFITVQTDDPFIFIDGVGGDGLVTDAIAGAFALVFAADPGLAFASPLLPGPDLVDLGHTSASGAAYGNSALALSLDNSLSPYMFTGLASLGFKTWAAVPFSTAAFDPGSSWAKLGILNETGGGAVESVSSGPNVSVDNSDPANPVVGVPTIGVVSITGDAHVNIDNTDPSSPEISINGYIESVVGGARVTVDNDDPANPIIAAVTGIPLRVFPTELRPGALVDGDAYFDSTINAPVWSYGGTWRDSAGAPVAGPPEIGYTVLEGGGFDGIVSKTLYSDTKGFHARSYIEKSGALYSSVDYQQSPGNEPEAALVRFNGTTFTSVSGPSGIMLDFVQTYVWVDGGVIYVLISTSDTDMAGGDDNTFLYTYNPTGSVWTAQTISTVLSNMRIREASYDAGTGVLYVQGYDPVSAVNDYWYIPDVTANPIEVNDFGHDLQAGYAAVGLNGYLIGWDSTTNNVVQFIAGTYNGALDDPPFAVAASFGWIRDANNIAHGVVALNGDVGGEDDIMYLPGVGTAVTSTEDLSPITFFNNKIGSMGNGATPRAMYVANAGDILGDHVKFQMTLDGVPVDADSPFYLGSHAYVTVYDGANSFLIKLAVSV